MKKEIKIIDTDSHKKHGANKCPNCGSSNVTYDINSNKLRCGHCRTLFEGEVLEQNSSLESLAGENYGSALKDIKEDNDLVTIKCNNCGAEIVMNTKETQNAKCHWCRSLLSINSQISNGVIPDLILPFKIKKETAKEYMDKFILKRKYYSNKMFKNNYDLNSIKGVYFPYIIIDSNAYALFKGKAGEVVNSYRVHVGKDINGNDEYETRYDIDLYDIERAFNITVDDLQMETSSDILKNNSKDKTTNIINSIMPFDTENCIKFKSNYLYGYTSEKRDVNIGKLEKRIDESLKDIARLSINEDLEKYDGGVRWEEEDFDIKGKQILSCYLPVWLFSYLDDKKILHYIAVNGRTGETMGSIPIDKTKTIRTSIIIFLSIALMPLIIYLIFIRNLKYIFVLLPILLFTSVIGGLVSWLFYYTTTNQYRNSRARHYYESETKNSIRVLNRKDEKIRRLRDRHSSSIGGVNSHRLEGKDIDIE